MAIRRLCKTTKTGKVVPHRKDGKCPKGSREVRKTVKKGRKKRRKVRRKRRKR